MQRSHIFALVPGHEIMARFLGGGKRMMERVSIRQIAISLPSINLLYGAFSEYKFELKTFNIKRGYTKIELGCISILD